MITYTEEQVIELIQQNLSLKKENADMAEHIEMCELKVEEMAKKVEQAEKKYADLAMRCIEMYAQERDIKTDTISVAVRVPRFMSQDSLADGMFETVKNAILQGRAEQFMKRGDYLI